MEMKCKFSMGDELMEVITGFTGIVAGVTFYMTGCTHYGLQTKDLKEGKPLSWEWFDESRLRSTGKTLEDYKAPDTSGPEQAPSGRW